MYGIVFDFVMSDVGDTITTDTSLNCAGCKLKPEHDLMLINALNGTRATGEYTLIITDEYPEEDNGTILFI